MVCDLRDVRGAGSAARSDALHALYLAMELAATGGTPRTFLIAAPGADGSDKKLAAALAEWLRSMGQPVLSIDAAAPHNAIAGPSGRHPERVLSDTDRARTIVAEPADQQRTEAGRGIGANVTGPLATSRSVADLLAAASKEYAAVVITAPPILARSDAMLLGRAVDMCVLVARRGKTRRRAVIAAIQRLREAGARIDGVVLTRNRGEMTMD